MMVATIDGRDGMFIDASIKRYEKDRNVMLTLFFFISILSAIFLIPVFYLRMLGH